MRYAINKDGTDPGYFEIISAGYTECSPRPSADHIPGPNWQTDPMNPAVMWVLDIVRLRAQAVAEIESASEEAAARYITSNPSQIARYWLKLEQARAHKTAAYPGDLASYPLIAAELRALQATTPTATAQQASDFILSTAATWTQKAAQIEEVRRVAKERVKTISAEIDILTVRGRAVKLLKEL